MKNLSFQLLLPVAAFVLASAGAVSSSQMTQSSKATTTVQGWNRISPFNCVPVRECNNISDVLCKDASGNQMYGKLSEFSDCTELLTHQP
ncbi:DUF6520 family protein [Flavobacterium sp.]|uniref:DUF6520 family protein n=1 Tax=Flavobacterium sp. TaxID=239 RepID=UPI002FDA9E41